MSGDRELTKEAFDGLLNWLDPNRERAGMRYETIRLGLVKMFAGRGCASAEELADETINRVAVKLPEIRAGYAGNPEKYFYGVAKLLYHEYKRRTEKLVPLPDDLPARAAPDAHDDLTQVCMRNCVRNLPPDQRELLRQYYQEKTSSAAQRKALAARLEITLDALRVRVFRIVQRLEACVDRCRRGGGG